MIPWFNGVEESAEIGVVLGEFLPPLREDKGNGIDVHVEGDGVICSGFNGPGGFGDSEGKLELVVNDMCAFGVKFSGMG